MITLNTDSGLIRIENFNEVYELPGFTIDVDPNTAKLETIIGDYTESVFVRCGLSTCHKKHGKGYVVTTADGRKTNIGKDCGKTHFGVDFETMRKMFDRDLQDKERRENLTSFQHQIPAFREIVTELRNQQAGADWVFRNIQELTTPGKSVPDSVVEVVRKVRLTREPTLTKPRFATKEEVKQIEVAERRKIEGPYYIDEPVGRLEGIAALFPENDLRELLVLGLQKLLHRIESLDVESLNSSELRANITQATGVDAQLSQSKSAVDAGRTFLQPDNLKILLDFAEDPDEQHQLKVFLKSLAA